MGKYTDKTIEIDGIKFRLADLKVVGKLIGYFLQPDDEFPKEVK